MTTTLSECLGNSIRMNSCSQRHIEIYYTWSKCPLCEALANQEFLIRFKDLLEADNKLMKDELATALQLQLNELDRSKFLADKKFQVVKKVLG